jgi:hypothetical protein
LIDLTLNHQDENSLDNNSEFNFTTTEGSLPPLDRTSEMGSEYGEEAKHQRNSRSQERTREDKSKLSHLQNKKHRNTVIEKQNSNKNKSIVITEKSVRAIYFNVLDHSSPWQ